MSGQQGPTKGPSSADDDTHQSFWKAHQKYIIVGAVAFVVISVAVLLTLRWKHKTQNLVGSPQQS